MYVTFEREGKTDKVPLWLSCETNLTKYQGLYYLTRYYAFPIVPLRSITSIC